MTSSKHIVQQLPFGYYNFIFFIFFVVLNLGVGGLGITNIQYVCQRF